MIWLTLWGGFAYFLLLPDNRAPDGVSQTFAFTVGQPGWLTSIMNDMSRLSGARGTEISVALAVLCLMVACGVFFAPTVRPALLVAIGLGLLFWLAQGLGGILTGKGTDPNTGPLLVLLAACYWPVASSGRRSDPAPDLSTPPVELACSFPRPDRSQARLTSPTRRRAHWTRTRRGGPVRPVR